MGCEHAQAAGGQTSPSQFEENTLSEVKRVIAVLSGKGGVGKHGDDAFDLGQRVLLKLRRRRLSAGGLCVLATHV